MKTYSVLREKKRSVLEVSVSERKKELPYRTQQSSDTLTFFLVDLLLEKDFKTDMITVCIYCDRRCMRTC
jgi:hypothetical protein